LLNSSDLVISKLPNRGRKITLLRSPHIDKKSREQFEIITHKSIITGTNFLGERTIDFLNRKTNNSYIEVMY
jgi:ribosomal protein S10